jgi:hypothetical protein
VTAVPDCWRHGLTPSGQRITCDGCRAELFTVDPATQVHPVRRPGKWARSDGSPARPGDVSFIVCPPAADGSHPCLDLAVLEESLDPLPGPDCGCGSCRTGAGRHR